MNFTNITEVVISHTCKIDRDVYDYLQKISKLLGTILYLSFFLLAIKIKEMRNRHMVYFYNLSFIGLFTTSFYGFTTFEPVCEAETQAMCEYQALFAYYSIYVSAYGVVAMTIYRLGCVKSVHFKRQFNLKVIFASLSAIWGLPVFMVFVPAVILKIPIYFNISTRSCRMDLINQQAFFNSYLILANILPTILIIVIDILIFYYLKASKNRINVTGQPIKNETVNESTLQNTNLQSVKSGTGKKTKKLAMEYRLLFQLIVLFLVFEIYAIANIILFFQTTSKNNTIPSESMKILRVFRWGYHVINPLIYLFMHPVIYTQLKELFFKK